MDILTGLRLHSPILSHTFPAIYATVPLLWNWMKWLVLLSTRIGAASLPMGLLVLHWFSFCGPLLVGTTHCRQRTPKYMPFWSCSDPIVCLSQFSPHQCRSDPYTCLFFLLSTHQQREMTVYFLPNVIPTLTDAIVMR